MTQVPLSPSEQAEFERDLAPARQALGADVAEAAWATGRQLSLNQAIAEVRAVA